MGASNRSCFVMKPSGVQIVLTSLLVMCCALTVTGAYNKDRVRLVDIQTFTAEQGHYTNARRGQPIPQMQCVGGSAGCKLQPSTMQCYNRGWDGRTIQWECKADLDDRVKFGSVHVSCEGFDFPGDEHVLAGSCGVEFTLEPTEKGSDGGYSGSKSYPTNDYRQASHKTGSFLETFLLLVVIGILIYAVYAVFFRGSLGENAYSPTGGDYPSGGGGHRPSAPPPAGFRPDIGGSQYDADGSCSGANRRGFSNPFGGFWSGAATGSMLGYMFGSRNRGYGGSSYGPSYYTPSAAPYYSSRPEYRSTSSDDGRSSTRSASGFGGTSVR